MTDKYLGNGNHKWERTIGDTFRLRVPGGWLYRVEYSERAIGLAFVPALHPDDLSAKHDFVI
jgi:hypothetical protein